MLASVPQSEVRVSGGVLPTVPQVRTPRRVDEQTVSCRVYSTALSSDHVEDLDDCTSVAISCMSTSWPQPCTVLRDNDLSYESDIQLTARVHQDRLPYGRAS